MSPPPPVLSRESSGFPRDSRDRTQGVSRPESLSLTAPSYTHDVSSELIDQPSTTTPPPPAGPTGGCPVPHGIAKLAPEGACPFPHDAAATGRPVPQRSRADEIVRRVLRIKDRPANVSDAAALQSFQRSMLISAIRCTLTYVVFPFVLPAVSFAKGGGPVLGIAIGLVAMVCDVFTIRRFFAVDHKWRWHFSGAALCVIALLTVLMVQDIIHLLR